MRKGGWLRKRRNGRSESALRPPKTKSEVISKFSKTTSLIGVQHILRTRSPFWIVAYVICVIMSIAQSWRMTVQLLDEETEQIVTTKSMKTMPFPSVTLCSNVILRDDFNLSLIPGFDSSVGITHVHDQYCETDNSSDIRKVNGHKVKQYVRNLTVEERTKHALEYEDFVIHCRFGRTICNFSDPHTVHTFNHPFYGNCFTFNPSFDHHPILGTHLGQALKIFLNIKKRGFWLGNEKDPYIGVLVHEAGTAPLMHSPLVLHLEEGGNIQVVLKLEEMNFYKKLFQQRPSCVDPTDKGYRQKSPYYTEMSPYLYSIEACMEYCEQEASSQICGRLRSVMPIQSQEYEDRHRGMLGVCSKEIAIDMDSCDCPLACTLNEYKVTTIIDEMHMGHDCEEHHDPHHQQTQNKKTLNKTRKLAANAKLTVSFVSNIYRSTQEDRAHSLAEYLGFMGGNLSLWIGLCIISLLEIVELVWNLCRVSFGQARRLTAKHVHRKRLFRQATFQPLHRSTVIGPKSYGKETTSSAIHKVFVLRNNYQF